MRIVQHRTSIVGTDRSVVGNDQSILGSIVIRVKRSTLASSINCWGCWTDPRLSNDQGMDRSTIGTDPVPSLSRSIDRLDRAIDQKLLM